jgi:methenyltetrahydromethanopterin cyclohydrolase
MTESLNALSYNAVTAELVACLQRDAQGLRLRTERLDNGVLIIDAGISCAGGLEAGRRIAEICLAGQGQVALTAAGPVAGWGTNLSVHTSDPVNACLGSQYAGWSLSHSDGDTKFHALGSGPGRILAGKEKLYQELSLKDQADKATLVLEVDKIPPQALTEKIAETCGVAAKQLTLILTPTRSLAGTAQVVARVLEVALHKAHELGFPLAQIVDGLGSAPLPPPAPDFLQAMGRTNDAILFAGRVHLFVDSDDPAAESLAHDLPSSSSRDYGRPFAEVFKQYEYDFFKIDPMLFSPAQVNITALKSGKTFCAGAIDTRLLGDSFGVSF